MMTVGVLALQGCVKHHVEHLKSCGANCRLVRESSDLEGLSRIILPGGESSTMLRLLQRNNLWEPLRSFVNKNPSWGVCAGAILLAQEVEQPVQESLQILPIRATRNFYGSQLDSFKTDLEIPSLKRKLSVDFIRAPKLESLSDRNEILAMHKDSAVLLRHSKTLVSAFHTELGDDSSLHQYFLHM